MFTHVLSNDYLPRRKKVLAKHHPFYNFIPISNQARYLLLLHDRIHYNLFVSYSPGSDNE